MLFKAIAAIFEFHIDYSLSAVNYYIHDRREQGSKNWPIGKSKYRPISDSCNWTFYIPVCFSYAYIIFLKPQPLMSTSIFTFWKFAALTSAPTTLPKLMTILYLSIEISQMRIQLYELNQCQISTHEGETAISNFFFESRHFSTVLKIEG